MKYVFGPLPTRRLGQSLGIDPIPLKTCNWNCVYCQLGRTIPLTNQRQEFFPRKDILASVKAVLSWNQPGEIDWVTFVGSGETTLHTGLGWLIREVKNLTDLPVAVITNGSLLSLSQVRQELCAADAVLPTLDAGNQRFYRKMNRPWPRLTFNRHVNGLKAFRQQYSGQLWIEVMLVKGLNDTEEALLETASILKQIHPDQVHVLRPTRPPAEAWVQAPDEVALVNASKILESSRPAAHARPSRIFDNGDSLEAVILSIITRHPMQEKDLERIIRNVPPQSIRRAVRGLLFSGEAQLIERYDTPFLCGAKSRFPKAAIHRRSNS